jgi:hypothetical protein
LSFDRICNSSLLLIGAGTLGGIIFTTVYSLEGATRIGYHALAEPMSALSLGPGGWVQQTNFIAFGLLLFLSAFGWRQLLSPGRAGVWFPLLRALAGVGLVVDGLFSQDVVRGYPPHEATAPPSLHGQIHSGAAFIVITSLAVSCFVLARRFASDQLWRGWAPLAAAAGVLTFAAVRADELHV